MMPPGSNAARALPRGRVAGIDYGRRRIGVAVCDAERIIASPLCIRETSGDHAADAAFFQSLSHDESLVGFVVGLPLHADGTQSGMSREAERFATWLKRVTGLPVVLQDERYTSHEADGMLAGIGLSRQQKKSRSDAVAAQLVLRGWMEAVTAIPVRVVVGCGYLGERVAHRWKARGDRVVGTTRSAVRAESLAATGIEPFVVDVTATDPHWDQLFATKGAPTTVLWAVGFDRSGQASYEDVHVEGLLKLLNGVAQAGAARPRIVLASSTGVWGDHQEGKVNEETPTDPSREAGRVLVEAERVLRAHPAGPGVTLRFAGLYGPGRLPRLADLRAGHPLAVDPDTWLNLIHIDDAAATVVAAGDAAGPSPLYVVADGRPVRRRDWYERLATLAGAPPPTWGSAVPRSRGGDKRVDSSRMVHELGVRLEHPDALAALPALLETCDRPQGHRVSE